MNRPKMSYFCGEGLLYDQDDYVVHLEKYCDGLEKALDKACQMLESYDPRGSWNAQDWKEWLMKIE